MVKFYESSFSYDYPFPAVTLAYFLRYPNPYSKHVLSTDVIDRTFDATTQRLSTTRLHLKRSKLPPAVVKLLPKGILGSSSDAGQSYILEKSVIDVREGWMRTESRNLEWTGILSVVEKQVYYRRPLGGMMSGRSPSPSPSPASQGGLAGHAKDETTDVTTTVTFHSRLGQGRLLGHRTRGGASSIPSSNSSSDGGEDETPAKKGFFASWSTSSIQRTIELVGMRRTRDALVKSKDGMNVVLERLRQGGLVAVLDGMRRDHEAAFGPDGPWKRAWHHGRERGGDDSTRIQGDPFEEE
ncbi:hypothetical protein MMC16_002012 [Acarospora aff. strigata]|nr:hypothetical protein [Acarospora aff. strigata]